MKTTLCVWAMLILAGTSYAQQGWRGIVPLQSTCEDVKRVLGIKTCGDGKFNFPDEFVVINFSRYPCNEKWPYEEWNVSPETVTGINITIKNRRPLASLGIDVTNYDKEDRDRSSNQVLYSSDEAGVSILTSQGGLVNKLAFFPAAKFKHLRCHTTNMVPKETDVGECCSIFHGTLEAQKLRKNNKFIRKFLDDFALTLEQGFGRNARGYLMAYGGHRAYEGEALREAASIKEYLVKNRKIRTDQIIIVDAGYKENLTIDLWISPSGVVAPTPLPTVHPSEVQMMDNKNCKN